MTAGLEILGALLYAILLVCSLLGLRWLRKLRAAEERIGWIARSNERQAVEAHALRGLLQRVGFNASLRWEGENLHATAVWIQQGQREGRA